MFDVFWSAWSFLADHLTLLHGLGALIGAGGVAAYLFVPFLAPFFAIAVNLLSLLLSNRLGVAVLAGAIGIYAGALYATHKADLACTARVSALITESEAAARNRDAQVAADLEQKYSPMVITLQHQADDLQKKVAAYEKTIKPGSCQLGTEPLRLRQSR